MVACRPSLTAFHLALCVFRASSWVFWFRQQRAPGNKITNYEEGIKKISAFSSVSCLVLFALCCPPISLLVQVESFWSLWTHVHQPSSLLPTTDYLLFHSGIRRPVWEDPLNLSGGKWIIRLRKGVADRLWEDLVLAVIGDQFDGVDDAEGSQPDAVALEGVPPGEWPEICGCTISVRQNEDIISLWNRRDGNPKSKEKIKCAPIEPSSCPDPELTCIIASQGDDSESAEPPTGDHHGVQIQQRYYTLHTH